MFILASFRSGVPLNLIDWGRRLKLIKHYQYGLTIQHSQILWSSYHVARQIWCVYSLAEYRDDVWGDCGKEVN